MLSWIREIRNAYGAGSVAGDASLDRYPDARSVRVVAGTLCGLGVALFPGFAVLIAQVCLVLAWAYLMISLAVGGLRGVSRGS